MEGGGVHEGRRYSVVQSHLALGLSHAAPPQDPFSSGSSRICSFDTFITFRPARIRKTHYHPTTTFNYTPALWPAVSPCRWEAYDQLAFQTHIMHTLRTPGIPERSRDKRTLSQLVEQGGAGRRGGRVAVRGGAGRPPLLDGTRPGAVTDGACGKDGRHSGD